MTTNAFFASKCPIALKIVSEEGFYIQEEEQIDHERKLLYQIILKPKGLIDAPNCLRVHYA